MIKRLFTACILTVFFCVPVLRAQVCFDAPASACTGVDVYFFSDCIQQPYNVFYWYVDGVLESTQTFPATGHPTVPSFTKRFQAGGAHIVKLGAKCDGVSGCSTTVVYAEHTVTVTGVPATTTLANSGSNKFCDVGSVSLSVVNPTAGVTYTWRSIPAGFSATGTSVAISNITASTQYYAKPSAGSCVGAEGGYSINVYRTIGTPLILNTSYRRTVLAGTGRTTQYWQRSSTGTDRSQNADTNWTVEESGDYYLRNYESSIDCWSVATGPASVNIDYRPTLASVLQVQKEGYNDIIMTNADKAHLLTYATYYWVKDATAEPAIERLYNNGATLVGGYVDRSGTYYLKGKDNGTGMWGPTLVIQASVRSADEVLNWIQTTAYDGMWDEGANDQVLHVAAESKAYFRADGGRLQTQTRSLSTGKILANQPLYDRFDKVAGETLVAPTQSNTFSYSNFFAQSINGGAYGYKDFDREGTQGAGTILEPVGMGNSGEGSLGWYYSAQNELEPNTPHTSYPYARTIEFPDMAGGKIRQSAGPGDQHHMGTGHDRTEYKGVTRALLNDYLARRRSLGLTDHRITNKLDSGVVVSKVKDEQGKFVYHWADIYGRVLVTARGDGTEGLVDIKTYKDVVYNFYDDAGRLVSAVSPNGMLEWFSGVDITARYPVIDKTTYVYDFQGRLLEMTEPDAGTTRFVYRKDGLIRFSQNAVQRAKGYFSYTHYDMLSRPVESGEYVDIASNLDFVAMNDAAFRGSPMEGQLEKMAPEINWEAAAKRSRVKTTYDIPDANFHSVAGLPAAYAQRYVRGAVSRSENENMVTWYSYDELGRLTWMAQKATYLPLVFVVKYSYNFVGSVLKVSNLTYNGGENPLEEFYHHYEYDKDGRLSKAYTSEQDAGPRRLRATYVYYLQGPLKRIELGNKTQGVDFVYNIQGWLTQINHPDPLQDPGGDANDAFGMVLDYYESDMNNLFPTTAAIDPYRTHAVPEQQRVAVNGVVPLVRFAPELPVVVPAGGAHRKFGADDPRYKQMLQSVTPANR